MKYLLVLLLMTMPLMAQQPQTQTAPIYAVNSKYTNGVAPGYAPTAGTSLNLVLGPGTANCSGTIENYAGGTLALTASATNYVYLNTAASCAPAVKTTSFTSTDIPIAAVVAGVSTITSITDDRTFFNVPSTSPGGSNNAIQVNNNGAFGAATSPQIASALNTSPSTQLSTTLLPLATANTPGIMQPDGTTCTVNGSGVLSCSGGTLAGDVNGAAGSNQVNAIHVGGGSIPLYPDTETVGTGAPLVYTGTQINFGALYVPVTGGEYSGAISANGMSDSALTPSNSPICPNGSGGAFTTSGCSGGSSLPSSFVGQSFTSLGGTSYTPSYGNNFYGYPSIDEFGDSITVGIGSTGSSPYPNGYGQLLIADFGGNGTDYAVSGATSADVSDVMVENYNPAYTHNPAVTLMIGTNDINAYGGNTAPYSQDVAGLLEWATVPRRSKVFLTDSQCSSTGTWTNSTSYGFPSGVEISTVSGSTYTCTVVTIGPALYIGFMQDTAWTAGSMSITIDGSSPGTNPTIPSLNFYGNQEAYKFTAFRYPVSAGSHTVVFTVTSTSGTATGTVAPVWMGSAAPISTVAPPRIFVADVPPQENNANATDVALYNTALQAVENQLIGDGLPIQRVNETGGGPTSAGWLLTYNATTNPSDSDFQAANLPGGVSCPASTTPGFHPNNCGHAHLRDAFEYYIQPLINISHGYVGEQTVSSTSASFTGWNTQSTYNSGNSTIGFVAAAFNQPAYTGIYTTNQYGGNYAMAFDPSFSTLGPATFLPYLGIAYGVDPNTSNIGGLFQSTGANEITLGGGTGSANMNFNLIGTLNASIGLNVGTGNPFAVDATGDSTLSAVTAATSTSAVNSPFRYWIGHYWNNSASAIDTWGCQIVFNTGAGYTNPESDLVCNGSGSSGAHYFKTNTVVAGTISSSVLNISASSGSQAGAIAPSQVATSSANYSSPEWGWAANYYNSSTSANATDVYYLQDVMGTGANPTATWKLIHTGSVGPGPSPGASAVDLTAADTVNVSELNGMVPIPNIQIAMPTAAIAANTCTSYTATTMTGLAATSTVTFQNATDDSSVVGWEPTEASLSIDKYPTAGTLEWRVCNPTSTSITPGAITMNVSAR